MDIISQVTSAMQTVLTTVADSAAVASGFLKRKRKLTGARMVQTLSIRLACQSRINVR